MVLPPSVIEQTTRRMPSDLRERRELFRNRNLKDVNTSERVATRRAVAEVAGGATQLERILAGNDLLNVNYFDRGAIAARAVCRISIADAARLLGYASGFLIGEGLLLTNNHVFPTKELAASSFIEFDYQLDSAGRPMASRAFDLDVDTCFVTSDSLDFSVVAVKPLSRDESTPLTTFGFLALNRTPGKALDGECLSIIQHPSGELKQIAVRENKLLKLLDDFVWYVTDTSPGSSGSPAFNDSWQVVALHHSGVPEKRNGKIIAIDGSDWQRPMGDATIKWIANEGVRISAIVGSLELVQEAAHAPLRRLLDSIGGSIAVAPTPPVESDGTAIVPAPPLPTTVPAAYLPVATPRETPAAVPTASAAEQVTFRVGDATITVRRDTSEAARFDLFESVSIDPNYAGRRGYDAGFLGTNSRRIDMPKPADLSAVALKTKDDGQPRHILPYHHFSVIMSAGRRMALVTAVNIDGNVSYRIKREADRWFFDPRIPQSLQIGEELYTNNYFDRGHLVRRLDPAWGASQDLAKVANDDTFHFTNCTPQQKTFNQQIWAGLENYILDNADNRDFKVTVFTGPIFRSSDRVYRGVSIPTDYWKVVAMVKEGGDLSATAYMLSQKDLVAVMPAEEFVYGPYKTAQVPIRMIEALTGLDFGSLRSHDPVATGAKEIDLAYTHQELETLEQIRL